MSSLIGAGTTGPCPEPCPKCGKDRLTTIVTDARGRQGVRDVCAHSWWLRPAGPGRDGDARHAGVSLEQRSDFEGLASVAKAKLPKKTKKLAKAQPRAGSGRRRRASVPSRHDPVRDQALYS